jgi:hypothetical protein
MEVRLRYGDVASARQSTWNVAGSEGPENFEQNRTDYQSERLFHWGLLEMLQVRQDTELHRRENTPETSARPFDAPLYPGPCRAQATADRL